MRWIVLSQIALPWWAALASVVAGIAIGVMGALPWRSTAQAARAAEEAAKSERDSMRDARNRAQEESVQKEVQIAILKKDVEVWKAKTDLNGFKVQTQEMFKQVNENIEKSHKDLQAEFNAHALQDDTTNKQTLAALTDNKHVLETLTDRIKDLKH